MTRLSTACRYILAGVLAVSLAACASGPPKDVTLKGSIRAAEDVNPDGNGRPSPVVVKIYQLKSNTRFEQADFFPLSEDTKATLQDDLLAVEEIILTPGEYRPYEGEFDPDTRFVGVTAGFRDIYQADWKDIIEMPEKSLLKFLSSGALVIKADRLSITVDTDD